MPARLWGLVSSVPRPAAMLPAKLQHQQQRPGASPCMHEHQSVSGLVYDNLQQCNLQQHNKQRLSASLLKAHLSVAASSPASQHRYTRSASLLRRAAASVPPWPKMLCSATLREGGGYRI